MIIDATTGSIARFVNHSCNPNCRMIKWIVSGQPRMALFAGDKPIMTGDELTYDYNFDPFSAKNVQKCLCGEPNCRGVLGPKPREVKPTIKNIVTNTVKAGKRKLQEMVGNGAEADDGQPKRKRAKAQAKVKPITSTKDALASVGLKVSKGAATALKKSVSTLTSSAKKVALSTQTGAKQRAKTSSVMKKTTTTRVTKAYGKKTPAKKSAIEATKTAKPVPRARGKARTITHVHKAPVGGMMRKTHFDLVSLRKEIAETQVEVETTVAVSPESRSSSWAATDSSSRHGLDIDRGAITVATVD